VAVGADAHSFAGGDTPSLKHILGGFCDKKYWGKLGSVKKNERECCQGIEYFSS